MRRPESSRRDGSCRIAVRSRWSSGLATLVGHGRSLMLGSKRRHAGSIADPIYGKFAGKTNAISRFRNNAYASGAADFGLFGCDYSTFILGDLLTVVSQHLA